MSEGYPEIKDKKTAGRGRDVITVKVLDHPAHSRDIAPSDFHFVFALKETSGRPEVSRRQRDEKRSHCLVTCAGGEVLRHWNTKTQTLAKQMP